MYVWGDRILHFIKQRWWFVLPSFTKPASVRISFACEEGRFLPF